MTLKKAWLTEGDASLSSLSLESAEPMPEYCRIHAHEHLFPAEPTPSHPLRHVINIGLFSFDDLIAIRDAINKHLAR